MKDDCKKWKLWIYENVSKDYGKWVICHTFVLISNK